MAIIYSYPKNTDILSTDIIVGTSTRVVNGRRKNITKNFEIGAIATFFNETSAIAITGQNNFFFQNNIAPGRKAGSISFILGGGANTPFNNITALRISKFATSGTNVSDYISTLLEQALIIAQTDNLNSFGIYRCNSITPVDGNPNFLDLELEVLNANGNILEDKFYGFAVYPGFVNPNIDPANYDFEYPLLVDGRTISIEQSTTTTDGYLSSVDWNIFNNKQNAITLTTVGSSGAATLIGNTLNIPQYQSVLTNPITGTGTISYVPRFTGTTTIGNGSIFDDGTKIGIGTTTLTEKVNIVGKIDIVYGSDNVFIGRNSGLSSTGGSGNTAIGWWSLKNITSGNDNTVVGTSSGLFSSGTNNTIVGRGVLGFSGTSNSNTAVGHQALFNALGCSFNTAIGTNALGNITTGTYNIGMGDQSGRLLTTGTNSVYLGNFTTASSGSVTNEIVIGSNNAGIGSNTVVLGNSSIVTTVLRGNVGIGTTSPISKFQSTGTISIGSGSASTSGTMQLLTGGASPISNRITYGTDGSGWKFAIGKNQGGTVTDQLVIQDNGNIGIGTTSPNALLNVVGSADMSGTFETNNAGSAASLIVKNGNGTTSALYSYVRFINNNTNQQDWRIGTYSNNDFTFHNAKAATSPMVITTSGNVGIGTTSPAQKLDVNGNQRISGGLLEIFGGSTYPQLSRSGASGGLIINTSGAVSALASLLSVKNNSGSDIITMLGNGNVGIGTTAPAQKLHIVGERLRLDGTHIEINPPSAGTSYLSSGTNTTNFFIRNREVGILTLGTSDLERMRITSAGNVGIGTTAPSSSAVLDLTSTTQGFLPPRMTTSQRTSLGITAAPGLIVYDTDDNKHYGWNGSSWNAFY